VAHPGIPAVRTEPTPGQILSPMGRSSAGRLAVCAVEKPDRDRGLLREPPLGDFRPTGRLRRPGHLLLDRGRGNENCVARSRHRGAGNITKAQRHPGSRTDMSTGQDRPIMLAANAAARRPARNHPGAPRLVGGGSGGPAPGLQVHTADAGSSRADLRGLAGRCAESRTTPQTPEARESGGGGLGRFSWLVLCGF
jgi:hypothetical protein